MAARNINLAEDCIFHSDRGSQYTSREHRCQLSSLGLRASVGRTGVCWDNAMAESFFGALKNELVHRTAFPTRAHVHRAIVRYIEMLTIANASTPDSATRLPQKSTPRTSSCRQRRKKDPQHRCLRSAGPHSPLTCPSC
ncbi:integrase core domain-containing protein [Streptomyces sp. NPDC008061]|uniref:integrase core domain-containing protein n=1 Tax=Streptomyces sp. NPDC008061 TaxID=3364805 RepID=UPI0036E92D84